MRAASGVSRGCDIVPKAFKLGLPRLGSLETRPVASCSRQEGGRAQIMSETYAM
jgi:hypothetical protein